jgi:chemotaxis protein MotB
LSAPGSPEILIIRRGSHGDHDEHHGGVWKIAYADFMTAMMAFFLVMWLINAANEETRSQVASYFNPVKLTDSVTSDKGLNQPKNKPKKSKSGSAAETKNDKEAAKEFEEKKGESETKRLSEEKLFKDPYVVLAQLAGQAAQGSPAGTSESGAATTPGGNAGLKDGEAYRDPFDPQSWQSLPELGKETQPAKAESKPEKPAAAAKEEPPAKDQHTEKSPEPVVAREIKTEPKPEPKPDTPVKGATAKPVEVPPEPPKPSELVTKEPPPVEPKIDAEAKALMKSIEENLGQYGTGPKPGLSVEATDEGLLISLTDTVDFGMFTIGSAEPKPKVVAIMEKIAAIIKDRPGEIVLRGHTDGRPYRSELYDNWRLSSARAQMAYYMLTRAGIEPKRVARIEGHADRMLKRPAEPNAAENRRIEILLKADKT